MKNTDERGGKPSASDGENYELCNGKVKLSSGMPDNSNKVAVVGDRIHAWLDGEDVKLDSDEMYMAKLCERDRHALFDLVFPDWRNDPPEQSNEERKWYANGRFSGKADVVAWRGRTALILDYKTGRIPVTHAKDNGQLRWLTVLWNQRKRYDEVTVAISQPHCGAMTVHTYDAAALKKARLRVMRVLRKMESPNPTLRAGAKQCKYCRAKAICPALKDSESALKTISDVETLSSTQLSGLLDILPVIEDRCKSIKTHAMNLLERDPKAIAGYSLEAGQSRRKITDPMGAYVFLSGAGLIDDHHYLDAASISVGKLQKAIAEYNDIGVGEAKREMEEKLELFIAHSEAGMKLVKEAK